MKKIILFLIFFSFLFIGHKTFAVLYIPGASPSYNCQVGGGVYENNTCRYVCKINGGISYFYSKNNEYEQCKNQEKTELKQKLYNEREETLSPYSVFFTQVGVNLTLDTSAEQYEEWLKELKETKINYLKEQENQQKIDELEERISNLESQQPIIETLKIEEIINTTNKENIIQTPINTKTIVQPITTQNKQATEEKISTAIESPIATEIPATPTKKSIFQKILNWFKDLI